MHEAQVQLNTTSIVAYMIIAGLVGFFMDRIVLVLESVLLRWKQ
ncbi:MAG TPA: nitrate ABC transporter substrate-binding protein [Candidatus Flavonifractor intestinipullorum]|uniref:Nitrate ABC transporter substrate-binding protein n=1 Tax=Candidatus Flavonifractor intestinipullorum TaxID=2838587 RepID=A0A9D2M981_9FIRM|nr:nitrate ABC transporter substrate-binding protein [Candidatus Flavonifractor intestinipullorum]